MSASIWSPGSTIVISPADLIALAQIKGIYCAAVGGTPDIITLTPTIVIAAYAAGQVFTWIASGDNTGPVTVAISGLAVIALTKEGAVALEAKDILSGMLVQAQFDGTRLILQTVNSIGKSIITANGDSIIGTGAATVNNIPAVASVAAHATTCNPWGAREVTLTGGAVTFTDIVDAPYVGAVVWVKMNAAHVWTDGAVFDVQGNTNYTATAGDWIRIYATTVSTFEITIFRASGSPAGPWVTPTFDAANFTANGAMTCTVAAGDVITYAYSINGNSIKVSFILTTITIGGVLDNTIYIKIPAGKIATKTMYNRLAYIDNVTRKVNGYCSVGVGATVIAIEIGNGANWEASVDATSFAGQIEFEIN